jgi:hypothetical protein
MINGTNSFAKLWIQYLHGEADNAEAFRQALLGGRPRDAFLVDRLSGEDMTAKTGQNTDGSCRLEREQTPSDKIENPQSARFMMCVLTRIGGNNRDDYASSITELQSHPAYLGDHDDQDYARFYFTVPEAAVEALQEAHLLDRAIDRRTLDDVVNEAIDRLKQGPPSQS